MEKQKNIIAYESIYDSDLKNEENNIEEKHNKGLINIIIYGLLMFLGLASIVIGLFFKEKSNAAILLERLNISDNNTVVLTEKSEYLKLNLDNIDDYFIKEIDGFVIIAKASISDLEKDFLNLDINAKTISNGTIKYWPKENIEAKDKEIFVLYHFGSDKGKELIKLDNSNYITIFGNHNINSNLFINILSYITILIPLFLINKNKIFKDFDLLIKDEENPVIGSLVSSFISLLALSIALALVVNTISGILSLPVNNSINQREIEAMFTSKVFILMLVMTVIAAPIVEEVVFRYSIFSLINNDKVALHVSSLIFGLIHFSTELQLLLITGFTFMKLISVLLVGSTYIAMGYLFGYYYKKRNKNLAFVIALHALNNLFAAIMIFF